MYKPPFCETTGILGKRCVSIRKNETTAVNQDKVTLIDFRFIEPITASKNPAGEYHSQELGDYKIYFDKDDDVKVGDKYYFNTENFWKVKAFDTRNKNITKLEIKQILDYSITCDGYKEAVVLSYN